MKKFLRVGITAIIILLLISTNVYADIISPNGEGNSRPTWEGLPNLKDQSTWEELPDWEGFINEGNSKLVNISIVLGVLEITLGLIMITLSITNQEQNSNFKLIIKRLYLGISVIFNISLINMIKELRLYMNEIYNTAPFINEGNWFIAYFIIFAIIMAIFGIVSLKKKNIKAINIVITIINVITVISSIYNIMISV